MKQNAIEVSIITGFLGSGKTTLLNQLIDISKEKRFAIIENEFGSVNIDRKLISGSSQSDIFELSNGCICCTLNAELGLTLNRLILSGTQFDHLIIETTGIADPSEIVKVFLEGDRVKRYFSLRNIITVVDGVNFMSQINENLEVRRQITLAGAVFLSKSDCISSEQKEIVLSHVLDINKSVQLYDGSCDAVQMKTMLELQQFSSDYIIKELNVFDFSSVQNITHKHSYNHCALEFDSAFNKDKLVAWLKGYLLFNGDKIYRVKGVVFVGENREQLVVNGVKSICQFEKISSITGGKSQLVFIGDGVQKGEIQTGLEALLL